MTNYQATSETTDTHTPPLMYGKTGRKRGKKQRNCNEKNRENERGPVLPSSGCPPPALFCRHRSRKSQQPFGGRGAICCVHHPCPPRALRLNGERTKTAGKLARAPWLLFKPTPHPISHFPFRYFRLDGKGKRRCCDLMWAVRTGEASRSHTPHRNKSATLCTCPPLSGFPS